MENGFKVEYMIEVRHPDGAMHEVQRWIESRPVSEGQLLSMLKRKAVRGTSAVLSVSVNDGPMEYALETGYRQDIDRFPQLPGQPWQWF